MRARRPFASVRSSLALGSSQSQGVSCWRARQRRSVLTLDRGMPRECPVFQGLSRVSASPFALIRSSLKHVVDLCSRFISMAAVYGRLRFESCIGYVRRPHGDQPVYRRQIVIRRSSRWSAWFGPHVPPDIMIFLRLSMAGAFGEVVSRNPPHSLFRAGFSVGRGELYWRLDLSADKIGKLFCIFNCMGQATAI